MQFAFAANQHVGRFPEDVYADIPGMQESSGERVDRRRDLPAAIPSSEEKPRESKSGQGSYEPKREKKGKDKKRGRKHNKRSRK